MHKNHISVWVIFQGLWVPCIEIDTVFGSFAICFMPLAWLLTPPGGDRIADDMVLTRLATC